MQWAETRSALIQANWRDPFCLQSGQGLSLARAPPAPLRAHGRPEPPWSLCGNCPFI